MNMGLLNRFVSFGVVTASVSFGISMYLAVSLGSKFADLIVIIALFNVGANLASYGLPAKLVNTVHLISDGAFRSTVLNFIKSPSKYCVTLPLICAVTYVMLDSFSLALLVSLACCLGGVIINLANYYRAKKKVNYFGFLILVHSVFFPFLIMLGLDFTKAMLTLIITQSIFILTILRYEISTKQQFYTPKKYDMKELTLITLNTVLLSVQATIDKLYSARFFDDVVSSDYARASLTLTGFFLVANIFANFYTTVLPELIKRNQLKKFFKLMNICIILMLPFFTLIFYYLNMKIFLNPIPTIVYPCFCLAGVLLINIKFFLGILYFQERANIVLYSSVIFFIFFAVLSTGISSIWHIPLVIISALLFQLFYVVYSYESPPNNLILS